MAAKVAAGDIALLERLEIDTGDFAFNMVPVLHTANRGETVKTVSNALLAEMRRLFQARGWRMDDLTWEIDLKLFRVGGKLTPAEVPQVVDQLVDALEKASGRLNDKGVNGVLLMVDEVDRITHVPDVGTSTELVPSGFASFFKVLSERLHARGLRRVGLCLCGVEGFLQVLKTEHPSVERVFRDVLIPPLTSAQSEQIITAALQGTGVGSTEGARRRIVKLSGNYPEPVHLIGSEAFQADTDGEIDESDVEHALDIVVRHVRANYLSDIIARANSGRDQDILRAMAQIDADVKTVAEVARRLELVPQAFGSNMTRLTRGGILRRERKGQYRFSDPLLEIYIRRVGIGAADDDA
jgi:DNA-binding transcriptional ArsR family regulator